MTALQKKNKKYVKKAKIIDDFFQNVSVFGEGSSKLSKLHCVHHY